MTRAVVSTREAHEESRPAGAQQLGARDEVCERLGAGDECNQEAQVCEPDAQQADREGARAAEQPSRQRGVQQREELRIVAREPQQLQSLRPQSGTS